MRIRIPAIQTLLLAALAISMLAGCSRGPMPPTKVNVEKFTALMEAASQQLTAKEKQESQASDEGSKHVVKKLLIDPFTDAGFDLDATLADYAVRLRDGNVTQDETQAAILVLYIFQEKVADLARWGFIKSETRDLVKAVHDKIQ